MGVKFYRVWQKSGACAHCLPLHPHLPLALAVPVLDSCLLFVNVAIVQDGSCSVAFDHGGVEAASLPFGESAAALEEM